MSKHFSNERKWSISDVVVWIVIISILIMVLIGNSVVYIFAIIIIVFWLLIILPAIISKDPFICHFEKLFSPLSNWLAHNSVIVFLANIVLIIPGGCRPECILSKLSVCRINVKFLGHVSVVLHSSFLNRNLLDCCSHCLLIAAFLRDLIRPVIIIAWSIPV